MKLFKRNTLQRAIKTHIKSRDIRYTSLPDAKNVGFIIDANDPDIEEAVTILIDYCKERKIRYGGIALDIGQVAQNLSVYSNPFISPIFKDELNKSGLVENNELLDGFIGDDFDILIDFTTSYTPLSHYLLATSVAHFKAGSNKNMSEYYDFILSIDDADNRPLFIKAMIKYLVSMETAY